MPHPLASSSGRAATLLPVLAVVAGIAAFSVMDATMKAASLTLGVGTALLLRNVFGTLLTVPLWLAKGRPTPSRNVALFHFQRSCVTSVMAALFFYGLVRIPMAEGMAISFFAPIIALYFAALLLGETIRPRAIVAAVLGLVGMVVIGADRFGAGEYGVEAIKGTLAIVLSAVFYALNLVMQRKQALLAGPVEIALFQNLNVALLFALFAPFYWTAPDAVSVTWTVLGAALATIALLFLSWGYARAEAQVLVPVEYTGFLWAALMGWLVFGESLGIGVVAGAALIVVGCYIGTRPTQNDT
ncbi:DMT family transporter [Novosphingobium guangzhouense]|uniref:Permease n=1 Tax=Novosphingobium guangzhouense TaxID=1850347 RepID=A0A2K2FZ26_9SPHN|nr:DMT family transporter [Novosphingobium guangzhouense]PNU04047.1 permease [Novosphingobium guangzhouense]